ncbi:MAG: class II glutamine amidotransferase [Candidatus Bathyarchaeia archaeon]
MACRMLIAAGMIPVKLLLDDFKLAAMNKNEKHELNRRDPNFNHADGWGILIRISGNFEHYKKEVACWEDPKFADYYNCQADLVLLHARRASPFTPINYEFTQPFIRDGWCFCHNGTIKDLISEQKSDSEQFFSLILDQILQYDDVIEAIRKTVNKIENYTALNFILCNKDKAFVLIKYQKYPKYYTMKCLQSQDYVIISSEILQNFKGGWKQTSNNTMLKLDFRTRKIETFPC